MRNRNLYTLVPALILMLALVISVASAQVDPAYFEAELISGETLVIDKTVTTPAIPPVVDICLLEDETGSFGDDIGNLQNATTYTTIYDTIVATSPDAQFAVAGFRDYPVGTYGNPGDWVYRLRSAMSPAFGDWEAGILALTAGGGFDGPEAQYDAIVAAAGPGTFIDPSVGEQGNCGWGDVAGVQRVLVVATDAPFHTPDGTHVNDAASTLAALNAQDIILIGLKAPGAGGELDYLAGETGGSVQALSSDGANIANAILAALSEIETDVWWNVTCEGDLAVTLTPDVYYDVPGESVLDFVETITAGLELGEHTCTVEFWANDYPEEGALIGTQEFVIDVKPLPVALDIKPGSCPNPINEKERGVLPLAIVGTDEFDVMMVDPATLILKLHPDDTEGVVPLRWATEYAAMPYMPLLGKDLDRYACLEYYESDMLLDLTVKFSAREVANMVAPVEDEVIPLFLTGNLKEEYGGTPILGEDIVWLLANR